MMDITNGEDPASPFRTPIINITGHNAEGRAIVQEVINEPLQAYRGMNTRHTLVWTGAFPPDLNDDADLKDFQKAKARNELAIVRPGGVVCRIVDFGPNNRVMMHRTQSLDFGVVMNGTIEMELDDGQVTTLTAGDVAVQRATMHAWRNPSKTEWARLLFVLQDSKPLEICGRRFKEDLGTLGHQVFPDSGNDV
ncbi:uncharacterized protein A1O9_05257 [Exophiala aquamarina CBS 119918]|uniref:Cupin type-2 domain-containing protein n=1 Tax=Exophiala aquamarina CBS 119918 TaxID=1182545 RepID=A0A072PPC6_9EURO|nr:uncharacterized protein A1O9_05257 [Exophiala aquamarina CBS 119918]KEF57340.1 hypothetical protein A1O9_05257 [Exophiala aquamarina CBS 119918]